MVNWDGPVVLNFGTGGKLQVSLSDATFNQLDTTWDLLNLNHDLNEGPVYGASVNATFKLLALDTGAGAVPEPATWGMMIMGFGLAGATLRRRRTAATFA